MINIYSYGKCDTTALGTGVRDCKMDEFGDLIGVALTKRAFKLDLATDTLNLTKWKTELKKMNVFPLLSASEFTDNTAENETTTSAQGIIETIRQGKPYFTLQYRRGSCLHKTLYEKRGYMRWGTILVFEKGILMRVNQSETELLPFTTGDFSVETLRLTSGTDRQRSESKFQLIYPDEFNFYHVFMTWESLGFNANDIEGVVSTRITVVGSTATSVTVKVTSACNTDDVIYGLDDKDLWALSGANTISTVVFNTQTETYTITASANITSGEVMVYLSDGTYNVVEDLDGNLFNGSAVLTIV